MALADTGGHYPVIQITKNPVFLKFSLIFRTQADMDPNRPYPEGFAWDEAWRQRQRADAAFEQLENVLPMLREMVDVLTKAVETITITINKL